MENTIEVVLHAETITTWFGIPITNALITSWVIILLLAVISFFVGRNAKLIPGKVQTWFEALLGFVIDYMADVFESRTIALRYFPLIMTIFAYIFLSNVLEFTPGIGSIGWFGPDGFLPLFRSVNTDLNVTLALAIISAIVTEVSGVMIIGFLKYGSKFVNFKSALGFFIGIIELISETARLISFSFRLFGNIFAGDVLVLVMIYFLPYVLPVPFMLFEILVGFIQAAIFALLTLFFIKVAITPEEGH